MEKTGPVNQGPVVSYGEMNPGIDPGPAFLLPYALGHASSAPLLSNCESNFHLILICPL